jgi:hypothetical protein
MYILRRMRWVGDAVHMEEKKNIFQTVKKF